MILGLAKQRVAKTYYNHFSWFFFHYDFIDFYTEYRKYTVNQKKKKKKEDDYFLSVEEVGDQATIDKK